MSLAVVVCLPLLTQAGCAARYSSEAIHGKVIDAKSKQAVEGAIIAMDWLVVGEEGYPLQQLAVMEAVTDKNGAFEVPGWGPRRITWKPYAVLRNEQPTLRIFKSGYVPIVESNRLVGVHYKSANNVIPFTLNDKTFEMKPFEGALVDYNSELSLLQDSLWEIYPDLSNSCGWRSLPLLLVALDKQARIFEENGILLNINPMRLDQFSNTSRCGYAPEIFKEYIR